MAQVCADFFLLRKLPLAALGCPVAQVCAHFVLKKAALGRSLNFVLGGGRHHGEKCIHAKGKFYFARRCMAGLNYAWFKLSLVQIMAGSSYG